MLVLWQLETHKKQFRPRLGSPITKLACSPGDKYFTVSLQNNGKYVGVYLSLIIILIFYACIAVY